MPCNRSKTAFGEAFSEAFSEAVSTAFNEDAQSPMAHKKPTGTGKAPSLAMLNPNPQ
jgi:hypothetical protein|tara:strand:- start:4629 stop:4799 length:171 start_codon:yes stop_codon:yes gene_type:complete